ncbi:helix-turn-helix transcriptional regulator [Streptomyces sp. NPDC050804]|uniref:helix-turn-helix transcriptional regulator n=1 Tax=Streptomyces sp. NPDC050804 TaxID=3154745 RepID=UPI00343A137B
MDFGAALRRLRTERGLSTRQLADRVPCSKTAVNDLETGRRPPTHALASALDTALSAGGTGRVGGSARG